MENPDLTDWGERALLDFATGVNPGGQRYLALFLASGNEVPTTKKIDVDDGTGTGTTIEVDAPTGYARRVIAFKEAITDNATKLTTASNHQISYLKATLDWGSIHSIGICHHLTDDEIAWRKTLDFPIEVLENDILQFADDAIVLGLE